MVEGAANPKGKRPGFWLRASFVAVAALGTLVVTGIYGYYNALSFWYVLTDSGHFDAGLVYYYTYLGSLMFFLMCSFDGLCCVGSVGLLCGTVF